MTSAQTTAGQLSVMGIDLEVLRRGAGHPLLLLHGFDTIDAEAPFLDLLGPACRDHRAVLARLRQLAAARGFRHDLRPRPSLSRAARRSCPTTRSTPDRAVVRRLARRRGRGRLVPPASTKLILVDPVGIKLSDRETATSSTYSTPTPPRSAARSWHDPDAQAPDYDAMTDEALVIHARNWEALCLYAWHPYMYNPQLQAMARPDRRADPGAVGRQRRHRHPRLRPRLCRADPRRAVRADRRSAGHHPEIEQPEALSRGSPASSNPDRRPQLQAWYHCENVYPFVPQDVLDAAPRCAPACPTDIATRRSRRELFEECLDEHLLCDELGVNIVSIEHHSGINSLYGASPMILGILARQTKKVRILSLGTLISIRPDPVRIAEEYATADVISRGRLEIGFVKSGDSEMVSGNANPVGYVDRFWEAIDLIQKTLTSHDGPFSWEGKYFTHRHVNIWPPALPAPAPADVGGDRRSGDLGRARPARHDQRAGVARARGQQARLRRVSRRRAARPGCRRPAPTTSPMPRFVYVGDTDEEGLRVGAKLLWFLNTSLKQSPQMSKLLPGRMPPRGRGAELPHRPAARADGRGAPGRQPDRHHRRAGDRARHPVSPATRTRSTGRSWTSTTRSAASRISSLSAAPAF